MQIVTNTVGGCEMRIIMASAPVTLGLNGNEKTVLKLLGDLADGKRPQAEARKFLKKIGYYRMREEEKRLAALIKNNPGIRERERREEEEYNRRDHID